MTMTLPLSSDAIDCVLTSLPDFATLRSTILVSRSFHEVFQAHPSSILASVAATHIGPEVLSCALRLAHFNRDEYLRSRANYVRNFPLEGKFSHTKASEITRHIATLAGNDSVLRELELYFSITCKDRTSGSQSLLNPRESLRFRRAFYRWWLFNNLFPPCYLRPTPVAGGNGDDEMGETGDYQGNESDTDDDTDTDTDTDGGDDDGDGADVNVPNTYLAKSHELRKEFLSEFSCDEVLEMWQVHHFMVFASMHARCAIPDSKIHDHVLLWNGPSTAAQVLRSLRIHGEAQINSVEDLNWDYGHPDIHWPGFLVHLQEKSYDISKVNINTWDPIEGSNVILDDEVEDTEECDECRVRSRGRGLWSSSNWHLLPCVITLRDIIDSLPGNIGWNDLETKPLTDTPWSYAPFVDRYVSPGTPDWSEGRLLCRQCVLKLMGCRVLNSLRELKAQSGQQVEDCWYGYNCRTQRRPYHGAKLNHLCDPTRGD